jgi:nucleoside-diphosphate-sugar epimerase
MAPDALSDLAARYCGARVLVTGAAGFVGANLIRTLARAGCVPHAVIRPGCRAWRLDDIADQLEFHQADVADEIAFEAAFARARPEFVIHLAAPRGITAAARDAMLRVNVLAATSLLGLVRKYAVRRLVVTGTALEYAPSAFALTERSPVAPLTWHGATKAAAHVLFRQAAHADGLSVVLLRLFHVYGPWESAHRLAPTAIRAALSGTPLALTGPGIRRDWVYVSDVVEALLLAMNNGNAGDVFNVGSGVETANEEFVACVEWVTGRKTPIAPAAIAPRVTDTAHRFADCTFAREVLGWTPRHDLQSGVRCTIEWYKAHPHAWSATVDMRPELV